MQMAHNLTAIIWNSVYVETNEKKREQEASSQIEPLAVHLLHLFRLLQLAHSLQQCLNRGLKDYFGHHLKNQN